MVVLTGKITITARSWLGSMFNDNITDNIGLEGIVEALEKY